jgi:SAM-dependent methyltransferase
MNSPARSDGNGPADPIRFFDRLGPSYGSRYQGSDRFHRYYFHERMEKAVRGLDLSHGHVLDIGSGTGDLYGVLHQRFPQMRFLASDVSAGMLEHSLVPPEQRLLGRIYEHDLGPVRFDAIYMLGVSTYMSREELEKNLAFAAAHLAPQGRFIITFTNAHGLDTWLRSAAKLLVGRTARQNVLSSGMDIRRYAYREIKSMMASRFRIERWDALNHTFFPFNRLLPGPSIAVAKWISKCGGAPAWLRMLSSDLMVHAVVA